MADIGFFMQVVLVGLILTLVCYCFVAAQKRPDKPWRMMMDPDMDDDEEVGPLPSASWLQMARAGRALVSSILAVLAPFRVQ